MIRKSTFLLLIIVLILSCASAPAPRLSNINEAFGKNWKLAEVYINNQNTGFNRRTLINDGFNDFFTITINQEQISGMGAPNRYSAPYTSATNDPLAVTVAVVRSTLMASIYQPERLKEHDFFNYLQNTYKWGLSEGRLILHSKTQTGVEVIMIFNI